MSDLLGDARGLRQRLYRLEVLLQLEGARQSRSWFTGKTPEDPERTAAPPPIHFRLTPDGRDFLKDVCAKVCAHGALDWTRADEIDFSKL
jgi:hypothetical protein